jgi:23S rRNA (adenine2503-C2)-methyltransferase
VRLSLVVLQWWFEKIINMEDLVMKTLRSSIDRSVNFVLDNGQEARYVRREEEYFIVYLSSHNGCNKACRFCHLTQTGQTDFVEATLGDFFVQAKLVLDHYVAQVSSGAEPPARRINFNWMARGEPLDNSVVTGQWDNLVKGLSTMCAPLGIDDLSFNISSIIPASYNLEFKFSGDVQPHIYYSLYSLKDGFRRRWLPKAHAPVEVVAQLAKWQEKTHGKVTLHWAMIAGENDDEETMAQIANLISQSRLDAKFNLVRYNPYSDGQGVEPDESILQNRFKQIIPVMKAEGSRIVPRVGFDVQASCGMFVPKNTFGA